MNSLRRTIGLLTIFSIAMGFFESAVVIYLRQLYYPKGFDFPLVPIPPDKALIEFLREAATMVMLVTIGMIAGRNRAERFGFFLFCFGVWDIFYYVFLKLFVDWPPSVLTPDILFLIPVPWVGPVLTPCIVSLTMIAFALSIARFNAKSDVVIDRTEWSLYITGVALLFASFIWDYAKYVIEFRGNIWTPVSNKELFAEIAKYTPKSFNWFLFGAGEVIVIAGIIAMIQRLTQRQNRA